MMTGALGRPSRWSLTARRCVCACYREGGRALYQRTRDAHVKRCRASTVEETRYVFFQHAEEALPMEDGHITETPIVEDDGFADEDGFDFDVTPSRSVTVDENDPISDMYMAALRLDATLVRHAASQLDRSFQQQRLRGIMLAIYRKTTLETRVKSEVLLYILQNYD